MMLKITSRQNPVAVRFRQLGKNSNFRAETGCFVGDSIKLLEEALKWGITIRTVLWAETPKIPLPDSVKQYTAPAELLTYLSPLDHSPGVLFEAEILPKHTENPKHIIVLESLQDPGNVGTVLRTANAFGIDEVILTGSCADPWSIKTLRAGMGAQFRQPFSSIPLSELKTYLKKLELPLYGTALRADTADIRTLCGKTCAVAVGNEGHGLSEEFISECDGLFAIPMRPSCESLNAAIAAAIIMWELTA